MFREGLANRVRRRDGLGKVDREPADPACEPLVRPSLVARGGRPQAGRPTSQWANWDDLNAEATVAEVVRVEMVERPTRRRASSHLPRGDVLERSRTMRHTEAMRHAIPIDDRVGLRSEQRDQLERALAQQGMLSDVVAWMARVSGMELMLAVSQDEYSNDVVLRWQEGLFLVYQCT